MVFLAVTGTVIQAFVGNKKRIKYVFFSKLLARIAWKISNFHSPLLYHKCAQIIYRIIKQKQYVKCILGNVSGWRRKKKNTPLSANKCIGIYRIVSLNLSLCIIFQPLFFYFSLSIPRRLQSCCFHVHFLEYTIFDSNLLLWLKEKLFFQNIRKVFVTSLS